MRRISEAPDLGPAEATDQLPARRGSGSGRLSVAALRAGLAPAAHGHSVAEIDGLQANTRAEIAQTLVAGANIAIEPSGAQPTVLLLHARSGPQSYVALTAARALLPDDNGRVLEGGAADVTLTVPPGLPKGFACLVRRTGTGNVSVVPGTGITFVPNAGAVATEAIWDEISLECVAAGTWLVRRIPA